MPISRCRRPCRSGSRPRRCTARPERSAAARDAAARTEARGVDRTAMHSVRLLGLDPGLQHTGWGLVESAGSRLRHLGDGVISIDADQPLAARLCTLHRALMTLLEQWRPDEAAVEHTY